MAGPTLKIEISAPGQKTVQASVDTILNLAAALRDLPKASGELQKLQQALSGGVKTGGLKSGAGDLKALVGEIQNLGAQLGAGFSSLENTIKEGYGKAAKAQEAGEAKLASKKTRATTIAKSAFTGDLVEVDLADFAKYQTGNLKLADQLAKAQERLRLTAESEYTKSIVALDKLTGSLVKAATAPAYTPAGASWWDKVIADQERQSAKLEAEYAKSITKLESLTTKQINAATMPGYQPAGASWWDKVIADQERQSAKLEAEYAKSITKLESLTTKQINAATMPGYQPAGASWWDKVIADQERQSAKLEAEYAKSITKLESLTTKQINAATMPGYQPAGASWWDKVIADQERQSAKLEAEYAKSITKLESLTTKQINAATMPGYQPAGASWWDKVIADQERQSAKLEAEYQKTIAKLETQTERAIKAATLPGYQPAGAEWWNKVIADEEAALLKAQKLEAAWAASSKRAQANTTLQARSQLSAGIAPETVAASFGSTALQAAQATTLEKALAAVHGEVDKGVPKFKALGSAMNDAHSAARGLASGFNAMFLTWGNIGPLLAGAALSHSFVQSIKVGADVRQDLETLRVLSDESKESVAGLEQQLISLGKTGPFGPREVAEAMKTLSLAGLNAAEVAGALKPALDFAITGGTGIEKAAENLVAIGTAYGYQADQFSTVADAVSKAAAISMSSVEGMAASFRTSSIIAQAYGVSLKDAAAEQALLANIGIRGTAAGTAIRQAYSELSGATSSTRKAMHQLGVEVVDNDGKMKSLMTIATQLSKALEPYSGKARVAAIQALSNERGSKDIVAMLTAVEAKAKEVGSTASNELERIRQLIEESAGFNAIAAAQLASTPANLMKSVSSAFQTALYQAFQDIEPTLIVVSTRLREAFASPEFRDALSVLARLVAALTSTLVDNAGAIKLVVEGYALFKGLQYVSSLMFATDAALVAMNLSSRSAAVSLTVFSAATDIAAAGTTRLTLAAGTLSTILRVAGPLAIAITLAAAAWEVYKRYSEDAGKVEAEATAARQDNTISSLDVEIKRLVSVNDEIRKGTAVRLAELKVKEDSAKQDRMAGYQKGRAPLEAAVSAAAAADRQVSGDPGEMYYIGEKAPTARSSAAFNGALAQLQAYDDQVNKKEQEIEFKQQVIKSEQNFLDRQKELENAAAAKTRGTKSWETPSLSVASSEISLAQKRYQDEKTLAEQAARQQQELLDIRHKGLLTSDVAYTIDSQKISEDLYAKEMASLKTFIADTQKQLDLLRSDPKKAVSAAKTIETQLSEKNKAEQELAFLQAKAQARLEAFGNVKDQKVSIDLSKLTEEVNLQDDKYNTSVKQLSLSAEEIAAEQAINAVRSKGNDILRVSIRNLDDAQKELDNLDSNDGSDRALALQQQVNKLRAALTVAQSTVEAQAQRSGQIAKEQYLSDNQPWAKFVAEGQNAMAVLSKSRIEFMHGWVDGGKKIWEDFITTGKLKFSSLTQLLQKTLADITYQRFLVKPFADVGGKLFDGLLGPVAKVQPENDSGKALDTLSNSARTLSSIFGEAGNSLYTFLAEFARGLMLTLQTSSGGGIGGIGGFLSGFFSQGQSGGSLPVNNVVGDALAGAAKGAWFDGSISAFGKGGMSNSVYSAPQMFRFGSGGKLGVLGEAGRPEAVVPLTRTRNGDLGVQMVVGSGQAGASHTIVQNNVVIEDHTGTAQVQRETGPDGNELTRVIVGAVAKDYRQGGATRRAVQDSSRVGTNLKRY